jgi:hypothetical protein
MKRWLFSLIASAFLLAAHAALANFHLFQIEQIYSNNDGSVQFIVLHEADTMNGENLLGGNPLISAHARVNKLFTFPSNLPSLITAGRRVLIATQGFAALGIVTPDYVIPNGFLPIDGGTLNYAGADSVTYSALPTDGVTAINRNGAMVANVATNFAGATASVVPAVSTPTAFVPIDGVWANTAESGRGFALGYKHGVLIVAIYAYLADGKAQWYLASGPVVNNVFTGTLDTYVGGQCISCVYTGPPMVTGNDGTITITFTSNTSATVNLPGGRVTQIAPFQF